MLANWNVAILATVLVLIVGGTWTSVKYATDHLLYASATEMARQWADLLVSSVDDLEQIGSGMPPSQQSEVFFDWAQKAGRVFRYEIYNRQGFSQLVSSNGVSIVDISEFSADAVDSLKTGKPVVSVFDGDGKERPEFYSRAFLPAYEGGKPVAIIAAYVDQTAERALFTRTFTIVGVILCALTGLAFCLPAAAWYKRTKEKRLADRRIRFLAHHDVLTGLINRARLVEQLEHRLASIADGGPQMAVHFVDLDKFKEINDAQGHDAGDTVLRAVAERLESQSRESDLVSRLGGDEFVVVQADVGSREAAQAFAERLGKAVSAPITLADGQEVATSASIGMAMAPDDGAHSERLLKCADLALYAAKDAGKDCARFFDPAMDAQLNQRISLERRLRKAVADGELIVHYQPIIAADSRRLIGFEALARLMSDDGELIPPAAFIPVAEDIRVIDRLGEWVLKHACTAAAGWPEHLIIAVNLSPAQFQAGKFSGVVAAALAESGLAPQRLELEITEQLLLTDSDMVVEELHRIKAMGVSIAMDDFGTGYSSLSYLWRFAFDKIKIDRSFIQALDHNGRDAEQIIHTIVALGRELNMNVTVEGVENQSQVSFLDEVHPDQVQGYFFGRPMPDSDVAATILADFTRQSHGQAEPPEADAEAGAAMTKRTARRA